MVPNSDCFSKTSTPRRQLDFACLPHTPSLNTHTHDITHFQARPVYFCEFSLSPPYVIRNQSLSPSTLPEIRNDFYVNISYVITKIPKFGDGENTPPKWWAKLFCDPTVVQRRFVSPYKLCARFDS